MNRSRSRSPALKSELAVILSPCMRIAQDIMRIIEDQHDPRGLGRVRIDVGMIFLRQRAVSGTDHLGRSIFRHFQVLVMGAHTAQFRRGGKSFQGQSRRIKQLFMRASPGEWLPRKDSNLK